MRVAAGFCCCCRNADDDDDDNDVEVVVSSCTQVHIWSGRVRWVTRRAEDKITPRASLAAPTESSTITS